ncbi:MAG: hypothetical protein DMF18_01375 [Verrucomicrobia bacterium]|nr:MAG: hypothetical protein DMF18_01375 [Verrucomicrobiota bacterium]
MDVSFAKIPNHPTSDTVFLFLRWTLGKRTSPLLARFAVVKREQIEWLKKRDAATSIEEKCKMMEARIKVLQELLW